MGDNDIDFRHITAYLAETVAYGPCYIQGYEARVNCPLASNGDAFLTKNIIQFLQRARPKLYIFSYVNDSGSEHTRK